MMTSDMKPYPAYKDSGIEWLGEIPAHWSLEPLWTMFRRIKRAGYENEVLLSVYRDYGVIPKSSRDDNFNKPSEDLSSYQLVQSSNLVINKMKAWQGSIAVSEYRGIVSPAYHVYSGTHRHLDRYIHYLLRSHPYVSTYLRISKGIRPNQWDLEPEMFSKVCVLLPSCPEQRAIAAFLDRETAKIDALVAKKERLIELLQEKRTSLISNAVTKGLDPDVPLKDSGVEWLGEIPAHWEVRRLRTLANIKTGGRDTVDQQEEGKYPFFVRSQTLERINTWSFDGEAVLTAGDGVGVGKVFHYVNGKFDYHQRVYKFSNFRAVIGRFFFYFFKEMLRFEVLQGTAKSTVDSLRLPMLQNFPVVVLPLSEQRAIVAFIDCETAQIDALIAKVREAIDRLKELRTALISAAVTGKIDVREATE